MGRSGEALIEAVVLQFFIHLTIAINQEASITRLVFWHVVHRGSPDTNVEFLRSLRGQEVSKLRLACGEGQGGGEDTIRCQASVG